MTQKEIDLKEFYITSDLAISCTISLWIPLEKIDKSIPHKAIFIFQRTPRLEQLVQQYWRGELRVEPQAYFNQQKIIKARLYERE